MPPNREPESILWLIPGNRENDAMVSVCRDMFAPMALKAWPKCEQILFTNTKDISGWPGQSYLTKSKPLSRYEVTRDVFLAAYHEGFTHEADIIIASEMTAAMLSYLMDFEGMVRKGIYLRRRPIIYFSPKLPEMGGSDINPGYGDQTFWWLLHDVDNMWLALFDNDHEVKYAEKELLRHQPQASVRKILPKIVCSKFEGFKDTTPKRDVVMWQGRANQAKRIDLATKILALLSGHKVDCEMIISSASVATLGSQLELTKNLFPTHFSLPHDQYLNKIDSAKVCLICSDTEGWPPGYFEMIERGAIPVIRDMPWSETFVTSRWPLKWKHVEDAVEMCKDAINNYDRYRLLLEECLTERWSDNYNFDSVLKQVWNSYIVGSDREYSLHNR